MQFLVARYMVTSRFGKVLIAVRDTESRTRFLGYRPEAYKLVVWVLSAVMAGIGGALYVPQVGIINPTEFAPANSIEAVIWVAVGGRGTLVGRHPRRGAGQSRQDLVHQRAAGALAVRAGRAVHLRHPAAAARRDGPVATSTSSVGVDPAVAAQEAAIAQETVAAQEAVE